MKRLLLILAVCAAGVGTRAQGGDAKVTHIDHATVAKGGTLVTASNLIVQIGRRTEAGQSELHDKETDTFYILSGSATFVTGGTMVGASVTAPGQQRGSGINGGQTFHLTQGDVMVIPAGTPHWFKEVPTSVDYYVVKIVAP